MVDQYLRQSALAHLGLDGRAQAARGEAGVALIEQPFRGVVNLRVQPDEGEDLAALEAVLGFALPIAPNTTAASAAALALWLGPDEWWVVTPGPEPESGPGMATSLRATLADRHGAVTDVSDSRTCLRISGPRARDLLCKGIPFDLHPRAFPVGHCAQSHLAKTGVVVHLIAEGGSSEGPTFELYVLRSFAEYLWVWLEDAAREYGLAITSS